MNQYRKQQSKPKVTRVSRQMVVPLLGFFIGYLSASFLNMHQLNHWLNTHSPLDHLPASAKPVTAQASVPPKPKLEFYTLLTATSEPPPHSTPVMEEVQPTVTENAQVSTIQPRMTPATQKPQDTPKPIASTTKTISMPLAPVASVIKPTVPTPSAHTPSKKPVIQTPPNKLAYNVQLAAFRTRQDAEKLKATLLLKGFEVNVNAVPSSTGTWFRVMVGPFASLAQAKRTQVVLAQRERMNGMIRKADV